MQAFNSIHLSTSRFIKFPWNPPTLKRDVMMQSPRIYLKHAEDIYIAPLQGFYF